MPRFTIDCHHVAGDHDKTGILHPLNTYTTDNPYRALDCLRKLFDNDESGINLVVIHDGDRAGWQNRTSPGQAPLNLDEE